MVGRMDGAVLANIWSLILWSVPRWHQALEFNDSATRCPEAIDDEGLEFQWVIPRSPREQDSQNARVLGRRLTE